jgi:hypothetical protein
MYIIGNALFGRVDKVAGGLFYVGTVFIHIFFIPLLPLRSFIVRRDKDVWIAGFRGVPITLSPKSVLFAWARAGAIVTILFTLYPYVGLGIRLLNWREYGDAVWDRERRRFLDDRVHELMSGDRFYPALVGIALALLLLWVLRAASYASAARAAELTALSGYPASQAELAAEKARLEEAKKYDEAETARLRSDPEFQARQARWQEEYRRSREGASIGGVLRDFARSQSWNVYAVRIGFVGLPVLAAYLLGLPKALGLVLAAILYAIIWANASA